MFSLFSRPPGFEADIKFENEVTGGSFGGSNVYSIVLEHVIMKIQDELH